MSNSDKYPSLESFGCFMKSDAAALCRNQEKIYKVLLDLVAAQSSKPFLKLESLNVSKKYPKDSIEWHLDTIFEKQNGIYPWFVEFVRNKLIEKAGPPIPLVASDDNDEYEEAYLNGMKEGVADRAANKRAKYLDGDEQGGDTMAHVQYIKGYVSGYA